MDKTPPEIGDNLFDLYLFDGSAIYLAKKNLASGQKYDFIPEGAERFRILGLEKSAGLDLDDVTGFIIELTFTGTGQFTGTMTPIPWEKTFDGTYSADWAESVQQTADGGYIIAGGTYYLEADDIDVYLIYYKPEDYRTEPNSVKAMPWLPLLLLDD